MAVKPIEDLDPAAPLSGTEKVAGVQGADSVLMTTGQISDLVSSSVTGALGAGDGYQTWALLNAVTGSVGNVAYVINDVGTHTDPHFGGTVANEGTYEWFASPAGWGRTAASFAALMESRKTAAATSETNAAASAASAAATAAGLGGVVPISAATATIPVLRRGDIVSGTANMVWAADGKAERVTATGTIIQDYTLNAADLAQTTYVLHVPFDGTFSDTPDWQEFNGASAIGSRVDMSVVGSEYRYTVTRNASATKVRIRASTTGTGRLGQPYITSASQTLIDTTTPAGKDVIAAWHAEIAALSGDLMGFELSVSTSTGSAATIGPDGRTVSYPSASINEIRTHIAGAIDPADTYTMVGRIVSAASNTLQNWTMTPDTGAGSGGGTAAPNLYIYGSWIAAIGLGAGASGAAAAYLKNRVDSRNSLGTLIPAGAAVVEWFMLLRNCPDAHKVLADPVGLKAVLEAKRRITAQVGSGLTGANCYASVADAYRHGHRVIEGSWDHLRMSAAGLSGHKEMVLRATRNSSGARPMLSGGTSVAAGDWTNNGDGTYYKDTSFNPVRIWEVSGGVASRMGRAPTSITQNSGAWQACTSQADVAATVGGFYCQPNTPTTGTYRNWIRPFGSTLGSKTWEFATPAFTLRWFARLHIEGIDVRYATSSSIQMETGSAFYRSDCQIGFSGANAMQSQPGSHDEEPGLPSTFIDAGNDGKGCNSVAGLPTMIAFGDDIFTQNWFDGGAPHSNSGANSGNLVTGRAPKFPANGKCGLVSIHPYDLSIAFCDASANLSVGLLWRMAAASVPCTVRIGTLQTDSAEFTQDDPTKMVVDIGSFLGRNDTATTTNAANAMLTTKAMVTIGDMRASGETSGGAASRTGISQSGGTLGIRSGQFKLFTTWANVSSGTFSPRGSDVRFCTTGLSGAGTIALNDNDPLIFTNVTTPGHATGAGNGIRTATI